ncbi:helix-turn-helix domain-containing protein [Nakamurella endophytica]|uniref:Transcriptional regulatory protein n=1 Tax=Nakamurella endophytica TaxID=1748367 RepID=A0A917SPR8_9ACTN|nr:helix-turn-helix transcriptional regulator [Nakamurella endophytica]GGL92772.1 putative transcriptional regulatory protein [Nakamurella endophytica]
MLLRDALGETLRDARTSQSRTLRDVSTAANVSLGYLSEVERGRKEASSELLAAICDALDLRLSDVLDTVSQSLRSDADRQCAVAAKQANSAKVSLDGAQQRRPSIDPALRIVVPYERAKPEASVA